MNREQAKKLIIETFENPFNKDNFNKFISNLLKTYDKEKELTPRTGTQGITERFLDFISSWERLGRYIDKEKNIIDILIVKLKKDVSLYKARHTQRNFIAYYLQGKLGTTTEKDAALVAFISDNEQDWRFSLVKKEYKFKISDKVKVIQDFTPAKRWSFLVGPNEKSHTAQSRFLPILEDDNFKPNLSDLEKAFDVEIVTEEFFEKYRDLFIKIKLELDKIININEKLRNEFKKKSISTIDFAKKILGQIVFLYFLQKKGWFGVEKGKPWGTGPKDFLRKLFNREYVDYKNFYNDILEPLFYEALRTDRGSNDHYYDYFKCKIPFLNGGLFDPINNFDWINIDLLLPNELFSNKNKTKEGDIGDGILDIFDRYNFTVNEEEPLEKEVALDPELLGKIYEKLNAIRDDNFNEYVNILKSSKKGEENKFNKEYGVYYTPREIVHYICQESLINYIETELNKKLKNIKVKKEDIEKFVRLGDLLLEHEKTAVEKKQKIEKGEIKNTERYNHKLPEDIINNANLIYEILDEIKICDPAVGSGAFPIGMLHEIVKLKQILSVYLDKKLSTYDLKRYVIENSLYGVDIDPGAVEICKLRFWLSLVVDENDFQNIKPLPNLDYKIICGDSLLKLEKDLLNRNDFENLEKLKTEYFNETEPLKKQNLKIQIDNIIYKITQGHKEFDFKVYFSEVFKSKGGFDIIIGNPPYVSTKGVKEDYKKILEKNFNFADDLYNHFYFKGLEILRESGILTFISSKTFWTIQTKKNLREHILKYRLIQLVDTANPFSAAMVDTCIAIIQKTQAIDYDITFIDAKNGLQDKKVYSVKDEVYKNVVNNVFFIPTDFNLKIYNKYGKKVKELIEKWWDKISTSKNILKYKKDLEQYRNSLKPGDITLLGLITEGGQGLATANNGKYIGVLEGTKWAEKVKKERPEKLAEFIKNKNPKELSFLKTKQDVIDYLKNLKEIEIRDLFDSLKEKYGRDIFGQGWIYRIVIKDEIADIDKLTEDEKLNGIEGGKTFVPYDKGDKEGNRWWAPSVYYIDWSKENVKFLKENSGKKGEGMPVVRNQQFYFKEGFCWTDVSYDIRSRIKEKSIHDVLTMSLFPNTSKINEKYIICLLNSDFMSKYVNSFVNTTVHFQINDARQLPIVIPSSEDLKEFEEIFNKAVDIQKKKFSNQITEELAKQQLNDIQKELDQKVLKLYDLI
jgi:hypothetical protein